MTFWALTKFGDEPSPELLARFERRCAASIDAEELSARELANAGGAMGRLGRDSPLLDRRRARRRAARLGGPRRVSPERAHDDALGPREARAAARRKRAVRGRTRIDLRARRRRRSRTRWRPAPSDCPGELALSAWAVATLNPRPERFETAFGSPSGASATTRDDPLGSRRLPRLSSVAARVEAVATSKLASGAFSSPQDFSNLAWAFAKLDHVPGEAFQSAFESAALRRFDAFESQNLANVAYAYAALDLPGAGTILPFVAAHCDSGGYSGRGRRARVAARAPRDLGEEKEKTSPPSEGWRCFCGPSRRGGSTPARARWRGWNARRRLAAPASPPDALTKILWAFAALRYRPGRAFRKAADERIARCGARFDAESVTLTLWHHATLGTPPAATTTTRFADELSRPDVAFKPQDLSLGFWAAAVLATSDAVRDECERENENECERGNAVFGDSVREVLVRVAERLPSLGAESVSPEGLGAVYAATLALESLLDARHAALLDEIRGYWAHLEKPAGRAWRATKRADPTVSKLQADVAATLAGLGVAHALEAPVQGGLLRPDFVLTGEAFARKDSDGGGPAVVVEVDGPYHYSVAVREEGEGEEDGGRGRRTGGGGGRRVRGVVLRGRRRRGRGAGEQEAAREHDAA